MGAKIYYDGQCPFCTRYTALLQLRDSVGVVELIDVRESVPMRQALESQGYDLDRGMVLDLDGQRYAGGDAMHALALLSTKSGFFNRFMAVVFQIGWMSRLLYPVLCAGRTLTLFALGRERIAINPNGHQSLFKIFSHVWGLLAYLHLLYYIYYSGVTHVFWTTWAIGLMGMYLVMRPLSQRLFVVLCGFLLWDAWAQMPVYSNHTSLRNFVLLGILFAAIYNWIRGRSWSRFMQSFAPVGRCLLAIMYVFGVFHKLNTDFLDPSVSCAVALWNTMPAPLPLLDAPWFHWLTIYGTLAGETAILMGLLFKPTRQLAIISGIAFHSLLALSGYGFYPSFSTLAVALHLLFLSPEAASRITSSRQWANVEGAFGHRKGQLLIVFWCFGLWVLTKNDNASSVGLFWMPWSAWVIFLVAKYGKDRPGETTLGPALASPSWLLNLISVLFFFNCYMPYLGLKTAQSMNMFANLALEGGRSNHLILRHVPGPFGYTNDVVKPLSGGPLVMQYAAGTGLYLTYYDLLNLVERDRSAVVDFEHNGVEYRKQDYRTLRPEIERVLHPRWFRNWFLFRPVDMQVPKRCSLSQ